MEACRKWMRKPTRWLLRLRWAYRGLGAISRLGWAAFGSPRSSSPFRGLTRRRIRWSSSFLGKVGMLLGWGWGRCGCLIWLRGLFGGLILSALKLLLHRRKFKTFHISQTL